jgi:hypothetical protein
MNDIGRIKFFFEKLSNRFHYRSPKSRLVCTTLRGVLSVYKRMVIFAILLAVGHGNFDISFQSCG